jgi:hypothetical protein
MNTFILSGKYKDYFFDPPPVTIDSCGQFVRESIIPQSAKSISSLVFNYHTVTRPYVSKRTSHTHQYHEFLAFYSLNLNNPQDFQAEIVLYMGKEQEKYLITKPTLVSFPPGFLHCPMEITRVNKPFFLVSIEVPVT